MSESNDSLNTVHLEPTVDKFEANGHTYYVNRQGHLPIERARWLEKFGIFSLTGREPQSIIFEIRKAYDANNASKLGDVAVILDNVLKSLNDMMARPAPVFYLCTLFINREGENLKAYDLEMARAKILDWTEAGIESDFFFLSALSYLNFSSEMLQQFMRISFGVNLTPAEVSPPDLSDLK